MSTVHITAVVVLTNNPVRTILYFLAIHLVFSVPFKPLFRRIFLLKSWVLLVLIFYPSYIIYIIFPQCCCCGYRPPSHCHTQEYISGGGQPLDCGLLISSLLRREFKKGSRRGWQRQQLRHSGCNSDCDCYCDSHCCTFCSAAKQKSYFFYDSNTWTALA